MRRRLARSSERGQTVPFWAAAIALSLTLAFFTYNYANTVRWQVRAQNAADSAAVAVLGQDAAVANNLTTLTYAMDLQTVRDKSVGNAIGGLIGNAGGNAACLQALATNCVKQYADLAGDMAKDTAKYDDLVKTQAPMYVGQLTDIVGDSTSATNFLNNNVFGANTADPTEGCVRLNTDCGFKYTAQISAAPGGTGSIIADVYACRLVSTIAAGVISPMVNAQSKYFYAIGHARETLAPASTGNTDPGTATNPLDGNKLLNPPEQIDPNFNATEGFTNFADTSINANYLIPKPAGPSTATPAKIAAICPPVPAS